MGLFAYLRLARAGYVLAREGAFSLIPAEALPGPARFGLSVLRLVERPAVRRTGRVERLRAALNRLGPTYVKFGQTLATRPDIVGPEIAADLSALQDRMEPFDQRLVPGLLRAALGDKADALREISAPIAAASIAQVHKARLEGENGPETVAVKILRPGIRERFARDLDSYYAGARLAERFVPALRRLKPVSVVDTLERSARLELDLRLEAAAISEFSDNIGKDEGFAAPVVKWDQVGESVLTTSFITAIPIRDLAAIEAAGIDRKALASHLMQSFLRHTIRDGFFHADMHPGNLFADPATQGVIAVDFGIMGRIGPVERRFLADILFGFITRDYPMMARRHFEIGYVPKTQNVDDFALALRAIGEPLHGRTSADISMARVLGQLFAVTDLFEMQTRPELILLQKTMVLVEGVARMLDPNLDMWTVSRPVVEDWLKREEGPLGRLDATKAHLSALSGALMAVPGLVTQAQDVLALHQAELTKKPVLPRWAIRGGFGLVVLAAILVIWRMAL